jgi:hypothetical protein
MITQMTYSNLKLGGGDQIKYLKLMKRFFLSLLINRNSSRKRINLRKSWKILRRL